MLRRLALVGAVAFACSLLVAMWLFEIALPKERGGAPRAPATSRERFYQDNDAKKLVEMERSEAVDKAIALEIGIVLGAGVAVWIPFARRQLRSER